ncbi:MAG: hypothetical protein KY467_08780 [Gemmatimonadetes bacterium]|nr:hypothetical protein [Gemmatimonadota bacterium]
MKRLAKRNPRPLEAPLPVHVHRAMAAAFCVVLFAYMTTLPDYRGIAVLLWSGAAFAAGVSLWHRRPRAAAAGLLGGAACALLSYPVRLGDTPELVYPALASAFGGVMMGSAANISLRETVLWVLKLPFRARRVLFLLLGLVVFVAASVNAELVRQYAPDLPRGAAVLGAAVAASVAGAVVAMTAGWMIGRMMRRLAWTASDDGDAWEYWEALYRW